MGLLDEDLEQNNESLSSESDDEDVINVSELSSGNETAEENSDEEENSSVDEEETISENETVSDEDLTEENSSDELEENEQETISETISYDFNGDLSDIKNLFSIQIFLIIGFFVAVSFIKGFNR